MDRREFFQSVALTNLLFCYGRVPRAGAAKELHVKLRMPRANAVPTATVNGKQAAIGGVHNDTVLVPTGNEKHFEVVGKYS